jgi:hypothetical protein
MFVQMPTMSASEKRSAKQPRRTILTSMSVTRPLHGSSGRSLKPMLFSTGSLRPYAAAQIGNLCLFARGHHQKAAWPTAIFCLFHDHPTQKHPAGYL